MVPARLILASASPRRRELLTQAGLSFDVQPANVDEGLHAGEAAEDYVRRLAATKAESVAAAHPASYVLGADTTVVLDGRILNKPADRAEAEQMLRQLSGRMHEVHTGIAVAAGSTCRSHVETTRVFVAEIPAAELAYYLSTGDSLDKAGAYGIQGYAARWIYRIEGDFFNVVGLPLAATIRLLKNG